MKKLLCIVGSMNAGGAETFLMKIYRKMDKNHYQMDFAVTENGIYDDEIRQLGGQIHIITPKSKDAFKNFRDIRSLVRKEQYKSVLRVSQNSLSALELFAAQLGGAKIRAYRSSNSNTVHGTKKELIVHKMFRWMPMVFANVRFAPSTEAAEFMFGKGCIQKGKAIIIRNGLAVENYLFSDEKRKKIRKEFDIDEKEVLLGHVGRFIHQKNHHFIIDLLKAIQQSGHEVKLLLVGSGDLLNRIQEYVNTVGLTNSVIFTGIRSDIPEILSAMDLFVFPSYYEGMPNTVIEAQASGLSCIISDLITREVVLTNIVERVTIEELDVWTSKAVEIINKGFDHDRTIYNKMIIESGYCIDDIYDSFIHTLYTEG